ncbi:uncharacterized protein [Mytilus edulis]
MHGIGKPPALMLPNPKMTSHDLNIKNYEIPCFEPLHDLANMIKNVITELPYQIKDPIIQKKLLHFSHTTNGERNEIRGSDARLALIKLSQFLDEMNSEKKNIDENIIQMVNALVDIVNISYLPSEGRTPKLILRLYNQTLLFAATCRTIFCSPVKMTARKFFGSHFHSITIHLAEAFRIFSLRSILTEEQERCFGDLRRISRNTTNRQPGNIAENCIVRFNYQQKEGNKQNSFHMQDSNISKQARLLKQHPRSAFTAEFLKTKPTLIQCHLERIADFMAVGRGIWWSFDNGGIVFHDGPNDPSDRSEGPTLHHFRSSNLKQEQHVLENVWHDVVSKYKSNILQLPLPKLKLYDDDGQLTYITANENLVVEDDGSSITDNNSVLEKTSVHQFQPQEEDNGNKDDRPNPDINKMETIDYDGKLDEDDKAASESTTSYSINDILAAHQQTEKQGLALQQTKEDENKKVRYMYNSYIKDKKIDDVTSTTTARKKAIKRKLFEEDKGEQDFINLKKLPTTDKMKMVKNFIVNSNKAVADVPRSEVDFCMELLGETDDTRNVIKFQMSLEKHPGNKSFTTSLDIHMAKLQTSVSKEHNKLKNMLLNENTDINASRSVNRKIRIAEMLMKKWKIYFW